MNDKIIITTQTKLIEIKRTEKNKRKITNYNLQMFAIIFVASSLMLLLTLAVDSSDAMPLKRRKRCYNLRRGGRLERHHRRSLNDWVNAAKHLDGEDEKIVKKHPRHSHRHKKKIPKIHKMELDQILKQMDSIVRPRFGR
uniref:Uncharacterized protein n=1 Tax=Meloidogyne enterolobii TaxID=390850 RepID=A0A6V7TTE2_MELEN|nr:unnamed protein product [Meloidogyne enterolobii]